MIKGYSIHIGLDICVKKFCMETKTTYKQKPNMNMPFRYQKALSWNTGKTEDKNKLELTSFRDTDIDLGIQVKISVVDISSLQALSPPPPNLFTAV